MTASLLNIFRMISSALQGEGQGLQTNKKDFDWLQLPAEQGVLICICLVMQLLIKGQNHVTLILSLREHKKQAKQCIYNHCLTGTVHIFLLVEYRYSSKNQLRFLPSCFFSNQEGFSSLVMVGHNMWYRLVSFAASSVVISLACKSNGTFFSITIQHS